MTIKEHEQELADLNTFFKDALFPVAPFDLNKYMKISGDPRRAFIPGEIRRIETYKGSDHVRDSLFKHLRELKAICEKYANERES